LDLEGVRNRKRPAGGAGAEKLFSLGNSKRHGNHLFQQLTKEEIMELINHPKYKAHMRETKRELIQRAGRCLWVQNGRVGRPTDYERPICKKDKQELALIITDHEIFI
jgi:hypothetical protein